MKKIHVVMASQGEYSDRKEWPLVAFESKEEAQQKVTELDTAFRNFCFINKPEKNAKPFCYSTVLLPDIFTATVEMEYSRDEVSIKEDGTPAYGEALTFFLYEDVKIVESAKAVQTSDR